MLDFTEAKIKNLTELVIKLNNVIKANELELVYSIIQNSNYLDLALFIELHL